MMVIIRPYSNRHARVLTITTSIEVCEGFPPEDCGYLCDPIKYVFHVTGLEIKVQYWDNGTEIKSVSQSVYSPYGCTP